MAPPEISQIAKLNSESGQEKKKLTDELSKKQQELGNKTGELKKKLKEHNDVYQKKKKELEKEVAQERRIGYRQASKFWLIIFVPVILFYDQIKSLSKDYMGIEKSECVETNIPVESSKISEVKQTNQSKQHYPFTVNTIPLNSNIKIMNIKEIYQPGIKLLAGQYVIKVSHSNYRSIYQCVIINDNTQISVKLEKR
ncbi:MAG: hypothetical protein KAH84_07210 [Thiomargarita sp.]|nr:hypothetical protein [Thiomargarita sp.]